MTGPAADVAAPSAVSAVADRGQVRLGEPFRVSIDVRHAPELRYTLAPSQDPGPFAILDAGCATRAGALDGQTRCTVDLALLDLGAHSAVVRLDGAGAAGPVRTLAVRASAVQAMPVTDPSIPASAIPLRGMPAPVPLYVPTWAPLAWVALGVAIALAVAVVAVRRIRERLQRAEERRRAAPATVWPSDALEEQLDRLEAAVGAGPAAPDAFFALSRAVRSYLAALSPGATLDLTSAELIVALRRAPIGGLDPSRLAALLAQLDRVKFAGELPDAQAWRRAVQAARAVLDSTRPPRWHPEREARRG